MIVNLVSSGRLDIDVASSWWGEQRHSSRILLRKNRCIYDDFDKDKFIVIRK